MYDELKMNQNYWDRFYKENKKSPPNFPSQFAVFAVSELNYMNPIVEFGCGSGRDAEFFVNHGFKILATDASHDAIRLCQSKTSSPDIRYLHATVETFPPDVEHAIAGASASIYGRFLLHAITKDQETAFLSLLERSMGAGCRLAFEYRTTDDAAGLKEYGSHYRRYIDHASLLRDLEERGFRIVYETTGRGYAKYRAEDAFVGRCIAERLRRA